MADDGNLQGGSITVLWPYSNTATLNITGAVGTVTSGGVNQSFTQTLSADKTFDFPNNCTPTVTVTYNGLTLLSQSYLVEWSQVRSVAPQVTWDADTLKAIYNSRDTAITAATAAIPVPVTSTTTALAAIGNAINTGAAKVAGYTVFNTTTNKLVTAVGNAHGDVWKDATGSTAHTPV